MYVKKGIGSGMGKFRNAFPPNDPAMFSEEFTVAAIPRR
jgi:hypothetical protein